MFKQEELDIYKKQNNIEYVYKLYYNWFSKEYKNIKYFELTDNEKKQINNKLINEIELE